MCAAIADAKAQRGDPHVEVQGRDIIVTLPGTNFMVTYFKPARTSHLIARPNWTNDPDASIELGEFLAKALRLANAKARELGWIVQRSADRSRRTPAIYLGA
ncbi:MAG: hypothetical protein WA863_04635 [Methyloceanibacter sp.]